MKRAILTILILGLLPFAAAAEAPDWFHLRTDAAYILGNTNWPVPSMGFSTHTRAGFDLWETEKAVGSLEAGVNFNFHTAPTGGTINFWGNGASNASNGDIDASYIHHTISLQGSVGHTFRMLQNRRLFLSIYGLVGYSWNLTKISALENNSSLPLTTQGIDDAVGALTASFSGQIGYDFHDNVGVFFKGTYLVPIEPGVHGNYVVGIGLSFNAFGIPERKEAEIEKNLTADDPNQLE